jgi:hypothetical protein
MRHLSESVGYWNQRVERELTGAYISLEGKIVLEQSPTQPPEQPKQTPKHRPNRRKSRNLSDWASIRFQG